MAGLKFFHEITGAFYGEGTFSRVMNYSGLAFRSNMFEILYRPEDFRDLPVFRRLWDTAKKMPYCGVGVATFMPETICRIAPVLGAIGAEAVLLVRNGLQTVESIHKFSMEKRKYWYHDWLTRFFGPYYQRLFYDENKGLDFFEAVCLYWGANANIAREIHSDPRCRVVRLEDLTSDVELFRDYRKWCNARFDVDDRRIMKIQGNDVERKNYGRRDGEMIWHKWSSEQRAVFKNYCEEAMLYFGYDMP